MNTTVSKPGIVVVWWILVLFSSPVFSGPSKLPCGAQPLISVHTRGSKRPPFFVTSETQHVLLSDVARYYVSCRGTNNIEWDYSGPGVGGKFAKF